MTPYFRRYISGQQRKMLLIFLAGTFLSHYNAFRLLSFASFIGLQRVSIMLPANKGCQHASLTMQLKTPIAPTRMQSVKIPGQTFFSENRERTISPYVEKGNYYALYSKYMKLRVLTAEEEMAAGKVCFLGSRLTRIRTKLSKRLGRIPSDQEWAESCSLSESELYQYLNHASHAKMRLVSHNIRFVDYWATKIIKNSNKLRGISYTELVAEGIKGLIKAVESYDGRGRFATYAQVWIRSELYRGITTLRRGFATHKQVMINNKARKVKFIMESHGESVSDQVLANELGISITELRNSLEDTSRYVVSVSSAHGLRRDQGENDIDDGEGGSSYLDLHLVTDQMSSFSGDALMWRVEFNAALSCLTAQERRTLSLRYGLDDGVPKSYDLTAELMCMSDEGVRKIVVKAVEKLRKALEALDLHDGPPTQSPVTTTGRLAAMVY